MTTTEDAIKAAMSVARDIAEGRLDPAALAAVTAEEQRAAFGRVAGPGDELWPLHEDITRQSIALGAMTTDELAEWVAVRRTVEGQPVEPSWIEQALAAGADDETEED